MAKKVRRVPFNYARRRQHFVLEKHCVAKYFPFLQCTLRGKRLCCSGSITPFEGCDTYKIRIEYQEGRTPCVYIVDPHIEPDPEYHIYEEGNLCLFYPRESPWSSTMRIHKTIIPWTAEWLVFYELWKLTGEWQGPEAPHARADTALEEPRKQIKYS